VGTGRHQRRQRWAVALGVPLVTVALVAVGAQLVGPAAAKATGGSGGGGSGGGSKTVTITINLPALVLDNLCNADVVNLSGDMTITTTTTPHRNGGYTVRTSAIARDLRGNRIAPPPPIGYKGDDGENAYSYYAPPPQPSTHRVVHWTRLVPQGRAPTMYLVLVIRETIAADGTPLVSLERAYLVCKPPRRH
jgi:hypothetical protein